MLGDEGLAVHPTNAGSREPQWMPENELIPLIRGSARVLGVILALFSLLMFIGESSFPPPLKAMAVFGGYAIGMFLALKWERAGATIGGVFAALLLFAIWSSRTGGPSRNPPTIKALLVLILGLAYFGPVILYTLCQWLENRDRKRWSAGS